MDSELVAVNSKRESKMKSSAYIIRNNTVIALVSTELKNGAEVEYSFNSTAEAINADREVNLVNAKWGKISRAKKWAKEYTDSVGVEVNTAEFLIK